MFKDISDLYMKVFTMLVTSVTYSIHNRAVFYNISDLFMKVSGMLAASVTIKLQNRVI